MSCRTLLIAITALAAGCYFEGSVAYHPRISQSVSAPGDTTMVTEADGGGWSAGINIGFYLDVQLPNEKLTGVAAGVSPAFNGYGIQPKAHVAKVATQALTVRGEVGLPFRPLGVFHTRAVFIYNWLSSTSTTIAPEMMEAETTSARGRMWFFGPSIGYRMPVANGKNHGFFVFTATAGVERVRADLVTKDDRAVHLSSTGVGARLLISPAFLGHPPKAPFETAPTPGEPVKSNAGCYYTDDPTTGKPVYKCM